MQELELLFEKANKKFLLRDTNLILSGVSERCLCGALMLFLHDEIQNSRYQQYYVDIEYNRNNGKIKTIFNDKEQVVSITCDIIVHSRGEQKHQDNLIAIEMKKSSATAEQKQNDKYRLQALTKKTYNDTWSYDGITLPEHVCGYLLGIYYEINILERYIHIEYYVLGILTKSEKLTF
ncbi:hypothetical protein [Schinkia azotoformans]|uniref:hypothetical protein n=1 Tax=Schinkia azotoformans TaxID=1454 RepID=UPI002DB61680|nr:hypothetical protein [Schinkia azotoformans]MEC1716983.1 hypothetical protein [Schinkia azotoformans]MEC1743266.1 hypothetical protein [Schinkia azotoformans]MEC1744843.1 hypothetical protein [Schinkia azotoformans]MEC1757023.1 hypothetical protein [Schinkia azotoformans]MEC1767022.1 hypothetical protein [Schinkia azotoformans]